MSLALLVVADFFFITISFHGVVLTNSQKKSKTNLNVLFFIIFVVIHRAHVSNRHCYYVMLKLTEKNEQMKKNEVVDWVCRQHNIVNKKLNKEVFVCNIAALQGEYSF